MKRGFYLIIGAALALCALAEVKAAAPDYDVVVVMEQAPTVEHSFTISAHPALECEAIAVTVDVATVNFIEPLSVKTSGALSFIPVAYGLRSRCRSNLSASDGDHYRPPLLT